MKTLATLALAASLVFSTTAPAFAANEDKLTGLDRARQASMKALDHANGRAQEARGELPPGQAKADKPAKDDRLTGRERAAASIAKGLERGNGNGNAYGRGHAAEVLSGLLNGKAPTALDDQSNHGAAVSAMVKAFNELKKQQRSTD